MWRRPVRALVAAMSAFGLIASAAAGTAFSVNSVQSMALATAASGTVVTVPCDGAYDISWTVSSGNIIGVRAVRIPPSTASDPQLAYCADMPYAILVADRDDVVDGDGEYDLAHPAWRTEWTGVTSPVTGSVDASRIGAASGPLLLAAGTAVQLTIGPTVFATLNEAQPTCELIATGGTVSVVAIDGVDHCLHRFDQVGTSELVLTRHRYEERFGPRPARPAKGGVVATGHDFAALDALMPHPVYAWMGWVQVLSPSAATFADLRSLFAEACDAVVAKYPSLLAKRARRS